MSRVPRRPFSNYTEILNTPRELYVLLTGVALPSLHVQARVTIADIKDFPSSVQCHSRSEGTPLFLEQLIIGF